MLMVAVLAWTFWLPISVYWVSYDSLSLSSLIFFTELGNLHQLETLEASGNQLTNVPTSLVHCSNLKLLALDKNRLNVFPRQLCQLKNLTELSLAGNLLEYLPPGKRAI